MLLDLVCYVFLIALLIYFTRVRPLERIDVSIAGKSVGGTILRSGYNLSSRIGLLNTPNLAVGDGILLIGTKSIHTIGMHFPIDIVFLDDTARVLGWQESVAPGGKKLSGPAGTRSVLELGAGTIAGKLEKLERYTQATIVKVP